MKTAAKYPPITAKRAKPTKRVAQPPTRDARPEEEEGIQAAIQAADCVMTDLHCFLEERQQLCRQLRETYTTLALYGPIPPPDVLAALTRLERGLQMIKASWCAHL